jgi:hypothetical protein
MYQKEYLTKIGTNCLPFYEAPDGVECGCKNEINKACEAINDEPS